jgi:glycogen debranching enzyme
MYNLMITARAQTKRETDFERSLVFATSQFINYFPACPLTDKTLLAAGLPHFAVGWSRCWGRDTFICSDLMRLYPNIFREVILQFASALRHGLIPNLLDEGRNPRYNCRDACWWFIRAIGEYIDETKDYEILKNKVQMLFLSSDRLEHYKLRDEGKKKTMLLEEIVHEIFQAHARGISFREWNSGYEIDTNMQSDGFNINLEVDANTGFIIGGNPFNCLTWMDKMGSSAHAGTKGTPATPRAGTPVELVGLLYNCLRTFESLYDRGYYSFESVNFQGMSIDLGKWA